MEKLLDWFKLTMIGAAIFTVAVLSGCSTPMELAKKDCLQYGEGTSKYNECFQERLIIRKEQEARQLAALDATLQHINDYNQKMTQLQETKNEAYKKQYEEQAEAYRESEQKRQAEALEMQREEEERRAEAQRKSDEQARLEIEEREARARQEAEEQQLAAQREAEEQARLRNLANTKVADQLVQMDIEAPFSFTGVSRCADPREVKKEALSKCNEVMNQYNMVDRNSLEININNHGYRNWTEGNIFDEVRKCTGWGKVQCRFNVYRKDQ